MFANIIVRKTAKESRKIDFFIKLTFSLFLLFPLVLTGQIFQPKKQSRRRQRLLQLMEVNDWIIGVSEIN